VVASTMGQVCVRVCVCVCVCSAALSGNQGFDWSSSRGLGLAVLSSNTQILS
jgi:hypothetical protein